MHVAGDDVADGADRGDDAMTDLHLSQRGAHLTDQLATVGDRTGRAVMFTQDRAETHRLPATRRQHRHHVESALPPGIAHVGD